MRVHVSVLADEVVSVFAAADAPRDGWIVDGTVGVGGHAARVLEACPTLRVLGVDQDPEILPIAQQNLARFGERARVRRGRMSMLDELLDAEGIERVVGWLLDLGASSLQFDRRERGFSFSTDGPLDMRRDPDRERTAADIVNTWDETDLADLFSTKAARRARARSRTRSSSCGVARRSVARSRSPTPSHARSVAAGPATSTRRRACSKRCGAPSTRRARSSSAVSIKRSVGSSTAVDSSSSRSTPARTAW